MTTFLFNLTNMLPPILSTSSLLLLLLLLLRTGLVELKSLFQIVDE